MTDTTSKGQHVLTSQTSKIGNFDVQPTEATPAEDFDEGEDSEEFDESKSDIDSLNVQDIQKLMLSNDSLENLAHMASSKDSHPQKAEQARQLLVTTWCVDMYRSICANSQAITELSNGIRLQHTSKHDIRSIHSCL